MEIPDVDRLLRHAAPKIPAISDNSVERLCSDINKAYPEVSGWGRLLLYGYFLTSFLLCLLIMVVCSLSWELIGLSFAGSFILGVVGWRLLRGAL
jgi:hypothetical protein